MRASALFVLLAGLAGSAWAGDAFSLDDLDTPAPAAKPSRAVQAPAAAGVKVNLYSDFALAVITASDGSRPAVTFRQNHTSVLLKALYAGDQYSMFADALHPDSLFELGVNSSAFGLPGSSFRFGRILVPFGDYEFHHLYGGYVDESGTLFAKLWSDLGVSWKWTIAEGLESELFVGNGFGSASGDVNFLPQPSDDNNLAKAVAGRFRFTPGPGTFLLLSGYWDRWADGAPEGSEVWLAGADAGTRLGPVSLKAGGFVGRVTGASGGDYLRDATYGEVKLSFGPAALRLRGGSINPDTRHQDDLDQVNGSLGLTWEAGPLSGEVTFSANRELYRMNDPTAPNNTLQLYTKFLLVL